jgi:hypothetical protein
MRDDTLADADALISKHTLFEPRWVDRARTTTIIDGVADEPTLLG